MPKVSEAHVEARKNQILKAAFDCFAQKGFQKTTMHEICREAELSPGAVYLYFKSKEEIIDQLSLFYTEPHRPLVESTVRVKKGFAKALSWGLAQLLGCLKEPEVDKAVRFDLRIWSEGLHNKTLRDLTDNSMDRVHKPMTQLIRSGQEAGEFDPDLDAPSAAYLMLALVIGLQIEKAFLPDLDVDKVIQAARSLIHSKFNRRHPLVSDDG